MLNQVLTSIGDLLNQHLVNKFHLEEKVVLLNFLVDQDGSVPQKNQNKIVLTLINLDLERNSPYYEGVHKFGTNKSSRTYQNARFNLSLLATASFDDYSESLKFLDAVIAFFQNNQTLDYTLLGVSSSFKSLTFDIANIGFQDTHNLWSAMGAKYLPSLIYLVRTIEISADDIQEVRTNISDIGVVSEVKNK